MALATWVVARALLAAECGTAEQVTLFLDTFEKARSELITSIRSAALQDQERKAVLSRTRQALDLNESAPTRPDPVPRQKEILEPQTKPVVKVKKKPEAVVAEAAEALDELFSQAVDMDLSVTEESPPQKTAVKEKKPQKVSK